MFYRRVPCWLLSLQLLEVLQFTSLTDTIASIEICDALKISHPGIRYQRNVLPAASSSHVVHAWFDASNPYLSRASPLLLACVSNMNEEDAISLGIKKVILFLLKMLKDDAGITSSDRVYPQEFGSLYGLEIEIEERLKAM